MMRDASHELARAESALWSLDPGSDRESWVRISTAAKAAGISFDAWHDWSAGAGNYRNEADCRSVWASIKDDGKITPATLFFLARSAGWSEQGDRPIMAPRLAQSTAAEPKPERPSIDPAELWASCKAADAAHPYIVKKGGKPDGLATYHGPLKIAGKPCDGALVLPALTLDGEPVSLQFVTDNGKLFLPGRKLPPDACLMLGSIEPGRPVYLVEGVGQGWSANKATGCAAVVCFGWGRVVQVAQAIKQRHPAARLVIVPDGGKEQQAAEIARALDCQFIELPPDTPRNGDINDIEQAEGIEAVRRLLESAKSAPQRFQLLTPAELAALPPVRWLVRGVLPQEGIAAVYGPPGSGKSFLTLDLLAHVADGRDWFGCRVNAGAVVYLGLEGEAGIAQRVQAWQSQNGPLPAAFRAILSPLDIRKPADRAELVQAVKRGGMAGGLLVLDTLNRAAPGADENSSAEMGEIIGAAKALQAELGGLVLLVHHSGKDAARGLRGHSSLLAALDASLEVTRDGDRREWRIGKAKDGEDGKAHPFRLAVVELGTDDDGEEITSCVCLPDEAPGESIRRAKVPTGGNQRIVWDALGELLLEEGKRTGGRKPDDAPEEVPFGRPCIRLEDAIGKTMDRLTVEQKRKNERTRQAVTALVTRGLLVCREGWLWCA